MPRTLPPASLSAVLAQETAEAFLVLLTVTDEAGFDTFLTSDSVETLHGSDTYQPFPFDITLPKNTDGQVSMATLTLSNVNRQFIDEIRAQTTPLKVNIKVVLGSNPNEIMAEFTDFVLRQVTYNVVSISGTLTLEDFLNEPVGVLMTGANFPGLFYQ